MEILRKNAPGGWKPCAPDLIKKLEMMSHSEKMSWMEYEGSHKPDAVIGIKTISHPVPVLLGVDDEDSLVGA